MSQISALFLDIGGVILSNGWDHSAREKAAETFGYDLKEMESRHHMTFDTYEVGKLTLEEYLNRTVFYKERPFTIEQFKTFMFDQSKAYPEMIELIAKVKADHDLKVAVVSNEGRELTEHRIEKFRLKAFVDFFISSCFVRCRKPDEEIYRLAIDISQTKPEEVVYLEDRLMFIQVAESLGIRGLHHVDYKSTKNKFAELGLI